MDNFGCWEQSHTIKSDGFGMRDEQLRNQRARCAGLLELAWGGVVVVNRKTGSQVQVDAHKKEAKCQYKEGSDDGSWPFYDRHRRLLIVRAIWSY